LTEDPAMKGISWYGYCENNPLLNVDPDGKQLLTNRNITQEELDFIEEIIGPVGYLANKNVKIYINPFNERGGSTRIPLFPPMG
jgi:type 1 glutamine amidotransferase